VGRPMIAAGARQCLLLSFVALAVLFNGCLSSDVGRRSGDAIAIDEELDRFAPRLVITPLEAGQWALELEIGSVNDAESGAIVRAAGRIAWVSFVVYRPPGRRLDSLGRREVAIDVAGVRGRLSPIVYAGVKWVQPGLVEGDEYVMMTIRTDRGVVVRTGALFTEWALGYDSTRLALRLTREDGSLGFIARRMKAPAADEFTVGAGLLRVSLRDSLGAIVWSASDSAASSIPRPLMPDRIGDSITARFAFEGRDGRTGRDLAPGRYRLTGEVAAMPRPYFIHEEISWSGR
jgi:hypothetical protein